MADYNRMSLNVSRLLSLIQENPPLWDPVCEDFKNRQITNEIWVKICRSMFEEWDGMDSAMQTTIMKDVRNRWRTCKDQFRKYTKEADKSGSAAPKRKVAHFEQLQFLKSSRVLRQSSGNITGPNSNDNECESQQSNESTQETELLNEEAAGPSGITSELAGRRALNDGRNTQANIPRRGGRTSSRGRGRGLSVETEALALLQRFDAEDHWDHISYTMAERIRKMPEARQWSCVPAVFELMALYASPNPIPDNAEIINAIVQLGQKYSMQTHDNSPNQTRPMESIEQDPPGQPSHTLSAAKEGNFYTQRNEPYHSNETSYLGLLYSSDDRDYMSSNVPPLNSEDSPNNL